VRASSVLAGLGLLMALTGGGVAMVTLRERPPAKTVVVTPSLATVAVERTDLVDTRQLSGTLGFGTARTLKGTGTGVVTKLPRIGAKVTRGTQLYRVNDQPVVVFYGDTPPFRVIDKPGLEGNDVLELRRNLRALGYAVRSAAQSTSDPGLIDALKRWQDKLGVPEPGALRPGQIVVISGPARVSDLAAEPGAPADGPLIEVTSTTRVVEVPMTTTEAGSLKQGGAMKITLPDAHEVTGKVTAISRSITQDPNSGEPPKVVVTIKPDKPKDVAAYDAAPVRVRFTTSARKGVLAVPVGALVALREGGYALQTPDGALVAVTTGVFAGGLVEVSGDGIAPGQTVVTTP